MKVGLLTHPLIDNYGGILQCVALYSYLQREGHDVLLLRKEHQYSTLKGLIRNALELIPLQNIKGCRYRAMARRGHEHWLTQVMPKQSRMVSSLKELDHLTREHTIEALVVGSDQVWRFSYINDSQYASYFLAFGSADIRRISYAASFGTDKWEAPEKIEEVRGYLRKFDAVSVRETSGERICKETFGIPNASVVLDPTLLWDRTFYEEFIENGQDAGTGHGILAYLLDVTSEKKRALNTLEAKFSFDHRYELLSLNGQFISVPDWLAKFSHARFVVTDSFHGMVFSIIFEKPFIVLPNSKRGLTRFTTLLEALSLTDRLVMPDDELGLLAIANHELDYRKVQERLNKLQCDSKQFLKTVLSESTSNIYCT